MQLLGAPWYDERLRTLAGELGRVGGQRRRRFVQNAGALQQLSHSDATDLAGAAGRPAAAAVQPA
ncbi:hypothetical protein MAHJHV63_50160 [Mycobacterium avium subsp. hominissuis]